MQTTEQDTAREQSPSTHPPSPAFVGREEILASLQRHQGSDLERLAGEVRR